MPELAGLRSGSSVASSIILRAKFGCDDSWHHLVELFAPLVYRWCWKARVRGPEADDVVQEVFVNVVRRLGDFRRDRSGDSFRGWLWTITRHELLDHWRRESKRPQILPEGDIQDQCAGSLRIETTGHDKSATGPEDIGQLYQRAVELVRCEFEAKTWQAFWQVVIDGRQAADVAADLGLTANAVYIAKSRVLRRLRDELGEDYPCDTA